jgi:hypothetical protein
MVYNLNNWNRYAVNTMMKQVYIEIQEMSIYTDEPDA